MPVKIFDACKRIAWRSILNIVPTYTEKRFAPFTPSEMFELVRDVGKYPQFLPWCSDARVGELQRAQDGREFFDAELCVDYKALRERFFSRVFLDRENLKIEIGYLDGPFRMLNNRWAFLSKEEGGIKGVEVDFFIEFAFRSRLLGLVAGPVFGEAAKRMTGAFFQRAESLYGETSRFA